MRDGIGPSETVSVIKTAEALSVRVISVRPAFTPSRFYPKFLEIPPKFPKFHKQPHWTSPNLQLWHSFSANADRY